MITWINFIPYLIYRFLRCLVHSIQTRIVWKINGVHSHFDQITNGQTAKTCQLLKIMYRQKLGEADMASACDFIWWHHDFIDPKDLLISDPYWSLYTLDKGYAYFVRTKRPWTYYNARKAPFVFMPQFAEGYQLARIPLKNFCQLGEGILPKPTGPVVYYSNAARTGSTLLTRVMQISEDRIFCIGEPDGFTSLSILHQQGHVDDELCINLLKSIIKYYCKNQRPNQTYLMKVQSNCVRLVPYIKLAMPNVKHMFTFRRNTHKVLASLEKILKGSGDIIVQIWNAVSPEVSCDLLTCGALEWEMCGKFGMEDCLDLAIILHVSSYYHYYINRHIFDIPLINYEDLIGEKEKTLKMVFELCELPYNEFIEEALKEFQIDSQDGTVLSQDHMKTIKASTIDERKVKKMNDMCDQLKIPRIPMF